MVQIDITNFKYKIIKTKKQNKNKMLFYHAINTGINHFQCQVFYFLFFFFLRGNVKFICKFILVKLVIN